MEPRDVILDVSPADRRAEDHATHAPAAQARAGRLGNTRGATPVAGDAERPPLVVHLDDDLDVDRYTAADLALLIPASSPSRVWVDLGRVGFLDSSGINLLLRLRLRAESLAVTMSLVNVSPAANRAIGYMGLKTYFGLTDASTSRDDGD